jgi:LEA14-like dessication related protein
MKKIVLLTAVISTGCVGSGKDGIFSSFLPSVNFDRLVVNQVDFEHISTDFVFVVENPNPVGFSVEHFNYALGFAGVDWASGDDPDGLTINPDNGSEVSLPVEIVFEDLYDMIQAARGEDNILFGLAGDFGIRLASDTLIFSETEDEAAQAGVSSVSEDEEGHVLGFPYDADGDFPALRKPSFEFKKIKVTNLSLDQVDLKLQFNVDNEHASNLIFMNFDYQLKLGDSPVLSGFVDGLDEQITGASGAQATANKVLNIPIQISTLNTISNLWDVFTGAQGLDIDFVALTDVDTPFGVVELSIDETGAIDIELE